MKIANVNDARRERPIRLFTFKTDPEGWDTFNIEYA